MASEVFSLLGCICVAVLMDWLFVTRIAGYYSDFDYRYWPLSRLRWFGVLALISAAIYLWMMTGSNGPLYVLIPFVILIIVDVATALVDVTAQRRDGYKKPEAPRYSDGEYGS